MGKTCSCDDQGRKMRELVENGLYRHFKGNLYYVESVATHSETGEQYVVYRALYGDGKRYVRPLELFLSPVDKQKYPEAEQENRFELIS